MFCSKCGEENPDGAKFCRNCGTELKKNPEVKKVIVEEAPRQEEIPHTTETTTKSNDNSDWIGCCVCLLAIFIIFAIFGH